MYESHHEVNWIIYNMLVSIYSNWLRLAPYILYYLGHTKMDKIKDIVDTIKNVEKDKQRIENLLKLHKTQLNRQDKSKNYNYSINNFN